MTERKAIIAASGVDGHCIRMTKEALYSGAEGLNGDRAVRMGANHDPFCMPYGKVVEAWVEPREDRHVLVARLFVEDNVKQLIHEESGEQLTLLDFARFPKPFNRRFENESNDQTQVQVDFVNFDNKQSFIRFIDEVNRIGDDINCSPGIGRKSLIPEPFIQIVLSHPEATQSHQRSDYGPS